MNTSPRFLLAKYVPDMKRMEPRNIGVFLWVKGRVRCRFLEAPSFVNDGATYKRWIEHWHTKISGDAIRPLRGSAVPVSDPYCMDALLSTQKGNYLLVDAGELLEAVRVREINAALDFLFEELVSTGPAPTKRQRHEVFSRACSSILAESGVRNLEGFTEKYDLKCPVYGVHKQLRFSYASGTNGDLSLYQRVNIDKEMSVHDAALKFRMIVDGALVKRDRCIAMVQGSVLQESNNGAAANRDLLNMVCPVVDVDERDAAIERLRKLVLSD